MAKRDMDIDNKDIVSAILSGLAEQVGQQRFDLWFVKSSRIELQADSLDLSVSNKFVLDWMRTNFSRTIKQVCQQVIGRQISLRFRVDPSFNVDACSSSEETPISEKISPEASAVAATPAKLAQKPTQSGEQLSFSPARRFANLESFVIGASNHLAATSAEIITETPGSLSPLLIFGESGLGKTHLLEAIWTGTKRRHKRIRAIYLSAEQFTFDYVRSCQGGGLPNFRKKYRDVHLLIVDDLHFLEGKKGTVGELLQTVESLLVRGRQAVFAADRSPADMPFLGPELINRMSGGMICHVDIPELETRRQILSRLAAERELDLPEDVSDMIARAVCSNSRELAGVLNRLHAMSTAYSRPISASLVEQALAGMIGRTPPAVRLPDIQKAIFQAFGVSPAAMQSKQKTKAASHPRMLAMWLARKHTKAALSEIGHFFGGRSHTTVISANKKVERWIHDGGRLLLSDQTWDVDEAVRRVEKALRVS